MFRLVFVVCCIYATLTLYMARALTDEQKAKASKELKEISKECLKDNFITTEEFNNLVNNRESMNEANSNCFLACFQKKVGFLDDEGMVNSEAVAKLNKYLYDDVDEIKMIQKFLDFCLTAVNSKPVSDGKKGCDRAIMAYKCKMDNAINLSVD